MNWSWVFHNWESSRQKEPSSGRHALQSEFWWLVDRAEVTQMTKGYVSDMLADVVGGRSGPNFKCQTPSQVCSWCVDGPEANETVSVVGQQTGVSDHLVSDSSVENLTPNTWQKCRTEVAVTAHLPAMITWNVLRTKLKIRRRTPVKPYSERLSFPCVVPWICRQLSVSHFAERYRATKVCWRKSTANRPCQQTTAAKSDTARKRHVT